VAFVVRGWLSGYLSRRAVISAKIATQPPNSKLQKTLSPTLESHHSLTKSSQWVLQAPKSTSPLSISLVCPEQKLTIVKPHKNLPGPKQHPMGQIHHPLRSQNPLLPRLDTRLNPRFCNRPAQIPFYASESLPY
jgi:hypothetical protein